MNYLDLKNASDIRYSGSSVSQVWYEDNYIWPQPTDYSKEPFTIMSRHSNNNIQLQYYNNAEDTSSYPQQITVDVYVDNAVTPNTVTIPINTTRTLAIIGKGHKIRVFVHNNGVLNNPYVPLIYIRFFSSEEFDVYGDITTLKEYPDTRADYQYLFASGAKVRNARNLIMPSTLTSNCFRSMFQGVNTLLTAPELPATTLTDNCYRAMFLSCSNLTNAPQLPATTAKSFCYYQMFQGCTSLTTVPELPATTVEQYCYNYMFENCTSLITAPVLPATTLATGCYYAMFQNCTSITTSLGISATTLASTCCYAMFNGCTSLTTAPELLAENLTTNCYGYMFKNCSSLQRIKAMFITTPSNGLTSYWVDGINGEGTFVKNPNATWDVRGSHGVPNNWVVQTN